MKKETNQRVAIGVVPILVINFLLNMHRLQFEQLTPLKVLIDMLVLIHPVLIGIILYRWRKVSKMDKERKA
ncbi:hypothetical protein [Streptococcus cuniculi]|uniref:Uncharacterized protein n=1 Tax=Streptococcus cuniculi TaxID=1432788 RepID=A0A4Y9JBG6_9STRE|nr:hypothetical protein [Streptococcus cuniculi]MBF0778799.1 hypothetical protein [Streptococcus cuniculi]TFU97299.1 hypothetical protein E4T82_08715 [Streptococcus cuniculi]